MATRSRIAVKRDDGYESVYCHWDGYPEWTGKKLEEHYNSQEMADKLMSLGDISSINDNIEAAEGVEHTFDNPAENVTIFYGRDRGEQNTQSSHHDSFADLKKYTKDAWGEFLYVFEDGKWNTHEV